MQKIAWVIGPTAVGKTEIAIQLARRLNGEIISCDSRLFYRGMDIGTAKPTLLERQEVQHHLIDIVEPDEELSLSIFKQKATALIDETGNRGKLPLLVGGTGQYYRAILEGWVPPAVQPSEELRLVLEAWAKEVGPQGLSDRLAVLDAEAARMIDPRNIRRTIRALEVIFYTGKRFSEQRIKGDVRFDSLTLGLFRPREELYARVDARIENMIAAGLVEEVRGLLAKGYSPNLSSISAIGYREIIQYLQGKSTLEDAIVMMKRATRQFIRRQANWFKPGDPSIKWFRAGPGVVEEMEAEVRAWLLA
jgi:tRNA dimethylallyltransferase